MHVAIVSALGFPKRDVFAREQAAALESHGHTVTVVAPEDGGWKTPGGVHTVPYDFAAPPGELEAVLGDLQPDILHVYDSRWTRRLRSSSIPHVFEIRSVPLRPSPVRQALFARTALQLRHAAAIGCTNPVYARFLGRRGFISRAGFSSWAIRTAEQRDPLEGRCVYQGSTSALRDLNGLLAAFRSVVGSHPAAHLVVVSPDASPELAARVERDSVLKRSVTFVVDPSEDDLAAVWRTAAVALCWLPSSPAFNHQPPLKLLDAMAGRIPFVATATASSVELANRYGGGTLAAPGVESFAEAMASTLAAAPTRSSVAAQFFEDRAWARIMERDWIPRYELALA